MTCKFFKNIFALNYMQGFCQVSATEASDPLPGTKEEGELPRQVGFWLLDTFCHYRRWARFWSLLCLSYLWYAGEQPGARRDGARYSTTAPGTFRGNNQVDIC